MLGKLSHRVNERLIANRCVVPIEYFERCDQIFGPYPDCCSIPINITVIFSE